MTSQHRTFSNRQNVVDACRLIEKNSKEFLEKYVADDVHWTVTEPTGKSTPISGIVNSRKAFMDEALAPLSKFFDKPLEFKIVDVVVQEQDENGITKVCLELEGATTLKKDKSEWRNYYSWVMHFRNEKAVVVRAYLDSAAVNVAMK